MKTLVISGLIALMGTVAMAGEYDFLSVGQRAPRLTSAGNSKRVVEINQLLESFNQRFDDVRNTHRRGWGHQFKLQQNAQIEKWKSENALVPVVSIRNDVQTGNIFNFFILKSESGAFLALVYEKSFYANEEDETVLRVLHVDLLKRPTSFLGFNSLPAASLQLKAQGAGGAVIELQYATDLRNQSFEKTRFDLSGSAQRWSLNDSQSRRSVRNILIETWMGLTWSGPNGGVKKLWMDGIHGCQSAQSCN